MPQEERRHVREQDQSLIERVAKEAAHCAVRETLISLGIRAGDPISVQMDMATLHELRRLFEDEEFKRDLAHVRSWRLTMESVHNKSLLTVLGLLITGILAALVVGIKQIFSHV